MRVVVQIISVFILAGLLALAGVWWRTPTECCVVDGTPIEPITRVEIETISGERKNFCSIACAKKWLESSRERPIAITVTDEISGESIDATLAYWVESDLMSRRETQCRVHAFQEISDASRHIRRFNGHEVTGFLEGQGKHLPWALEFTARTPDGVEHHLGEYRGRVVFLRFFTAANKHAGNDLRQLGESYQRWHEAGFDILAMTSDQDQSALATQLGDTKLPFPLLLDPDGVVGLMYQVIGYPTGILIDRTGVIRERTMGEVSPEAMSLAVEPLVRE